MQLPPRLKLMLQSALSSTAKGKFMTRLNHQLQVLNNYDMQMHMLEQEWSAFKSWELLCDKYFKTVELGSDDEDKDRTSFLSVPSDIETSSPLEPDLNFGNA
ncbi:hypothetical protein J6590_030563 [Homalodisca vitripennis]|nr:hypothetical protein J6590_030563 [Homalodisca vitripennis]